MLRRIGDLLAERAEAYAAADLVVDTDGIGPDETAREILDALDGGPGEADGTRAYPRGS
jgi:hypothetical protein